MTLIVRRETREEAPDLFYLDLECDQKPNDIQCHINQSYAQCEVDMAPSYITAAHKDAAVAILLYRANGDGWKWVTDPVTGDVYGVTCMLDHGPAINDDDLADLVAGLGAPNAPAPLVDLQGSGTYEDPLR